MIAGILPAVSAAAQEEVRTFGQHLAHIAKFNLLWCSQARGETNPNAGVNLEKTVHTKAEFLKSLNDSYAYCDGAYTALTDASGAEVVTAMRIKSIVPPASEPRPSPGQQPQR